MSHDDSDSWTPFRPTLQDLEALKEDVSEVGPLQQGLVEQVAALKRRDRVAHQYQIAGGKVILKVASELPDGLRGIGLFEPAAEYVGIGRISTGLGEPHAENNPDFLGLMLAFQTKDNRRVDFLALNDPASPADDHHEFMDVLHATGESAGTQNFFAVQGKFAKALASRRGPIKGGRTAAHIVRQTARTSLSSTAYQTYWTGIVEVGATAAKFTMVPVRDENKHPRRVPGARDLSEEWARRQTAGDIEFDLFWIPFLSQRETSTEELKKAWNEKHKERVGTVIFPRADLTSAESRLWAILATEMGANPGNWVHDKADSFREPATRFGAARKIAYAMSQKGRNAVDPALYQHVFATGEIDQSLAQELTRRREEKEREGHVSSATV